MLRAILAALALTSLIPLPSLGAQVSVKYGDTLSEIAERYNVSLSSLMSINGISNSNQISVGQKLTLPSNSEKRLGLKHKTHQVVNGETINSIANKYGVTKESLIATNKLRDPNYLFVGQKINLPVEHDLKSSKSIPNYHKIKSGQTLSEISSIYAIPLHKLIDMNQPINPNTLKVGRKIYLAKVNEEGTVSSYEKATNAKSISPGYSINNSSPIASNQPNKTDWRNYGPLKVDWANWKLMSGSYVAPTLHKSGKALYLAINCNGRKLNATDSNGDWRSWITPLDEFEHNLINDLCKLKNT